MYLHKLYSEPEGLFDSIQFKNGINFIFAKKDNKDNSKKSLNGVGKSLLLNFLDFCLLSSENEHIKSAKKNNSLDEYLIVLEFIVNSKKYIIKRPLKTPNTNILFGLKDSELKKFSLPKKNIDKELSKVLCDLFFQNKDYKGKYSNTWLRQMMPFFIKKQENPKTKVSFSDPIKFSRPSEMELIPYHLLFLGIDNSLFWKNFEIKSELKIKSNALDEVKNLVQDTYNLKDINQAENEIDKLNSKVVNYEKNIKDFQLLGQYKDIETQSNTLTAQIKELWYQNNLDNKKIDFYKESYALGDEDIKTIRIKNLYSELSSILGANIKKTLDEAIAFRKNIANSRKEFLLSEIASLEAETKNRYSKIEELEAERAKLFSFLEAQDAIKDLSQAYLDLSKKREMLSELEGKIKLYQDLNGEVVERETELAKLYSSIVQFVQGMKDSFSDFRSVFFDVHNAIYPENKDKDFGIIFKESKNKDSKVNMKVYLPATLSKGKNQGCTLIYDLSVLFHAIKKNINIPHFLVHDGIFDGMDKAHLISLYEYMNKLSESIQFQYIVTLNEAGTLSENFGKSDILNPEIIEKEAIINLTPSNKLLKKEWD